MIRAIQILFVLLVVAPGAVKAREGYVRTRLGGVFDGHLRFESNSVVVVNLPLATRNVVALSNLVELVFLSSADSEPAHVPGTVESGDNLPLPWGSEDIGQVTVSGGTRVRRDIWRVRSSGTNALGNADACHFVFKAVGDRSELVARVVGVPRANPWARAGLMIRESMAPGARHVFASISAARGGVMSWRERYSDEAQVSLDGGAGPGWWLKLKRDGNQFSAFKSRNAMRWTLVERWTMPMSKDCYVGLAVTGNSRGAITEALFEGVEESVSLRNRWFMPQVELAGGSIKTGYIDSMDERFVYFDTRYGREPMTRAGVSQVRFQPLNSRGAREFSAGRRGVLLTSGEFVEGECRSIDQGRLVLSSVPLGLLRYDVNSDVVAISLGGRRAISTPTTCEVRMNDGSVWRGNLVEIHPLGVRLREPTLGWRWLPLNEVRELRCAE
jgi:regulation of enolase protein 1 (concanavalin A-like superfamily)